MGKGSGWPRKERADAIERHFTVAARSRARLRDRPVAPSGVLLLQAPDLLDFRGTEDRLHARPTSAGEAVPATEDLTLFRQRDSAGLVEAPDGTDEFDAVLEAVPRPVSRIQKPIRRDVARPRT